MNKARGKTNPSCGQRRAPIAEAMRRYAADGAAPYHTPGHKQGLGAHPLLSALITEEGLREDVSLMEELDDLHAPHASIAEAEHLAAELYGADAAYFMINGTTGAIHAMLMAALVPGDTVLVPRNAHRSVTGALVLAGARPIYLAPEVDARLGIAMGVAPETVRHAIERHPKARAVLLVNPTYYGVTTDLAAIADIAHAHDMALLVDEAHGPHLRFSEALPAQAIEAGADMAAQSTHKILGAMTQGSLLLARGSRVAPERVRQASSLLQSTSPNQLLLASIDIARLQMAECGKARVGAAVRLAEHLRSAINEIDGLWCFGRAYLEAKGQYDLDVTKLTVNVAGLGLTGVEAGSILRHQYKIECELSDARNVLFILSYADGEREAKKLLRALCALATHRRETHAIPAPPPLPPIPAQAMAPRTAFFAQKEAVPFWAAKGRTAAEQVMFYPPGIPVLVPGDVVDEASLCYIAAGKQLGLNVSGAEDAALERLLVVQE